MLPRKGRILFEGQDVSRMPAHKRTLAGIALVPEGRRVFPALSVKENLEMGGFKYRGDSRKVAFLQQAFDRGLPLPSGSRGIVIDAGFSVRVIITGEPVGERYIDINFTDAPSLDYWVNGQLVREQVYSNIGEALKRIRTELPRYVTPPEQV